MIKLEHVTTNKIVLGTGLSKVDATNIVMLLRRNSIEDYQALKEFLQTPKAGIYKDFLIERVREVEAKVKRDNTLGLQPKIFTTNGYTDIDDKSIKITERKTKGNALVIKNPALCHIGGRSYLSTLSVQQIKHLLSHVVPNKGINAFRYEIDYSTQKDVESLIFGLNFFERQIERQAEETNQTGINLFTLNSTEKREIIEENIPDIIDYFTDIDAMYVWGTFSQEQKKFLLEAATGRSSFKHDLIKNNLIDVVSNYTTLSEIENGVKVKTLEKFIAK